MEEIGICVLKSNGFYLYYVCYDFEIYFSQENLPKNNPKLTFETCHIPLGVGIATNVLDFWRRVLGHKHR